MNKLLLNDFFTVESKAPLAENSFRCEVALNADHPIFKGHFEQMPVVPGVCQCQMIMELLQEETGKSLWMPEGDNIKFTGMIVPTQHPRVFVDISYKTAENDLLTEAKIYLESTIFTKFKGVFKTI